MTDGFAVQLCYARINPGSGLPDPPLLFFTHRRNEYLIFQKIIKLEYEFPEKFFPKAKDLVKQLLVSLKLPGAWPWGEGVATWRKHLLLGYLLCFSLRTLQSGLDVKRWEDTTR